MLLALIWQYFIAIYYILSRTEQKEWKHTFSRLFITDIWKKMEEQYIKGALKSYFSKNIYETTKDFISLNVSKYLYFSLYNDDDGDTNVLNLFKWINKATSLGTEPYDIALNIICFIIIVKLCTYDWHSPHEFKQMFLEQFHVSPNNGTEKEDNNKIFKLFL